MTDASIKVQTEGRWHYSHIAKPCAVLHSRVRLQKTGRESKAGLGRLSQIDYVHGMRSTLLDLRARSKFSPVSKPVSPVQSADSGLLAVKEHQMTS